MDSPKYFSVNSSRLKSAVMIIVPVNIHEANNCFERETVIYFMRFEDFWYLWLIVWGGDVRSGDQFKVEVN